MSELSRLAKLYGLLDISHLGSGINLTNFAGGRPTGKEISGYLRRRMLPPNEEGIGSACSRWRTRSGRSCPMPACSFAPFAPVRMWTIHRFGMLSQAAGRARAGSWCSR
jgi:hypothetical protein